MAMDTEFLVIGGAGFIGSNIVSKLVADGRSVRVFDNLSTGHMHNLERHMDHIEFIEGDIRDKESIGTAVRGVQNVLLLAALPSVARSVENPEASNEVNISGTLNVLVEARDAGVDRLVFSSSSSVYGNTPVLPKSEEMTPNPLSPYAVNKLTAEHYCRVFTNLYGFKAYALRYFNVYGPQQDPNSHYAAVIPKFIKCILNNESPIIEGDGEQTRDFTFISDVVAANLACCTASESAAGGAYNAAQGGRTSVNQLAAIIAQLAGKEHIKPVYVDTRKGDVRDSQAAFQKAKDHLNWEAEVSLEEGLAQTIDWYAKQ